MARRAPGNVSSAFRQVQNQARSLLNDLRKQIRGKELELKRLKEEEARLGMLIGRPPASLSAMGGSHGGGRINWRTVLAQLPKQFKAIDIRNVSGLREKRPSEIFAAVTRWIEAGLVKRKSRGLYERIG